jgi:hypothetical protein
MDGSWRGGAGGFLRRRLAQRWEDWQMRRLIRESAKLGKSRSAALRAVESLGEAPIK